MDTERGARVVVGVDCTPQGLAALRAAASQAAWRGVPLHAVRVTQEWAGAETGQIDAAFDEAFGAVPPGLVIERSLQPPPIALALAQCAGRPGDLLVIGTTGRGLWHALWSGSIARACICKARCALLVVPAPPMARELHRRPPWRRRRPDLWRDFERESALHRG